MTESKLYSRPLSRREFIVGGTAVSAGLWLSACGIGGPSTVAKKTGGTLNVDLELEAASFNPLRFNYQHIRWVTDPVNETLYQLQGNTITPVLAADMPHVIDNLNVEVPIKSGIKFHNGQPMTATDVAATFNAARGGVKNSTWVSHLTAVADVKAVGPTMVHFTFSKPWVFLLDKLTLIPIMPADAVEMTENIPGTGPFIFKEHVQGDHVQLTANRNYRSGPPNLSEIIYHFVPNAGTRLVNLQRGDTQVSPAIPYSAVNQLKSDRNLTVYEVDALINLYGWVSSKNLPDVRVRQALAYALDRQKIVDVAFGGHAVIGQGPIAPALDGWSYTHPYYGPGPDVAKAKSLLSAAGVSNLQIDYVSTPDAQLKDMAAIVQQNWSAIGVRTNVELVQLGEFITKWVGGDFGIAVLYSIDYWSAGRSPQNVLSTVATNNFINFGKFSDPQLDANLAKGESLPVGVEQFKAFAAASDIGAEKGAMVPPAYPKLVVAVTNKVHDLPAQPLTQSTLNFYPVWLG
jgi:peptide/nickel transport system substrate-binding protein